MATTSFLKANGLHTYVNSLEAIPDGALFQAKNVVIDRDGVIEPRRGIKILAELEKRAKQLLTYKNVVFAHYGDAIAFYTANGFIPFKGRYDFTDSNISSSVITINNHGLENEDVIVFSGTNLPTPIIAGNTYYVTNSTLNTFQVSLTAGGVPITLIPVGSPDVHTVTYDYIIDEPDTNQRIKYIEQNGSLYVTTANGVVKITEPEDYNNWGQFNIKQAGVPRALGTELLLDFSTDSGYLDNNSEASYRVLWGTKDINGVLTLGSPSYRTTIQNVSGEARNVFVTFLVPSEITTDYFFQIYRSEIAPIDGSSDEMRLVYEEQFSLTSPNYDPSTREITILDNTPAEIRDDGTYLYSNELTGDGYSAFGTNDRPPIPKDIALYKNVAFYANTKTRAKTEITILGLDGFNGIDIQSLTPSGSETIVETVSAHKLVAGNYVVIKGASVSFDNKYVINSIVSPTQFKITADPTGVVLTSDTAVVYTSYLETEKNTIKNRYYFVGRPEAGVIVAKTKASTPSSSYFLLNGYDGLSRFCFWFDKTGTDTEPVLTVPEGQQRIFTKIDISGAGVVTEDDVALKIVEAMDLTKQFISVRDVDNAAVVTPVAGRITVVTTNSGPTAVTGYPTWQDTSSALTSIVKTQTGHGQESDKQYARISSLISPAAAIEDTAKSLSLVMNKNENETLDAYYLPSISSLPGTIVFESKQYDNQTFTVKSVYQNDSQVFAPDIKTPITSTTEEAKNKIYASKTGLPEAVPALLSYNVGPKDKAILRIIALRDSLFILKEEGLYRLSGDNYQNFNVTLFDNSATITAPDSGVVLNNQIYCLTTQGVSTISETGVSVISRPIENLLKSVSAPAYSSYKSACFGVSYESDRSYMLFTQTRPDDETATQCFRFNTFTQCWTTWDQISTCGIVESSQDLMYLGAGDVNAVEVERKTLTSRDYADRQYQRNISLVDMGDLFMDNISLIKPGDVLIQQQYVSVSDVNRLIIKLNEDPLINVYPQIALLEQIQQGEHVILKDKLDTMANLLNQVDEAYYPTPTNPFQYPASTSIEDCRDAYNQWINKLNVEPYAFYANYKIVEDLFEVELYVTEINKFSTKLRIKDDAPFFLGACTHYSGIDTLVDWAHNHFGEPSIYKHIREGVVLLESNALIEAMIGFASDLSGNFEMVRFELDRSGVWSNSIFGEVSWGGLGTAVPLRTIVPRQKQRCRYIRTRFSHRSAMYKFSILGIAYTYRSGKERAYRY